MKKKILIVSLKNLNSGRRIYRQIFYLKDKYDIHTMGFEPALVEGVPFYKIIPAFQSFTLPEKIWTGILILTGRYKQVYKLLYKFDFDPKSLSLEKYDLIIVHDLKPFPLIDYLINHATPVMCDAHEYYFDMARVSSISDFLLDRIDKFLIKRYLFNLKYITTVGEWIAGQYKKATSAKVYLILSACEYYNLAPAAVDRNKIKIIHHGYASPDRKIELMIQVADFLDERFSLDIMLTALTFEQPYIDFLKKLCAGKKNVRIIPPVAASELVRVTNKYDIGLFLLPGALLSHRYAMPNKFFEYIQARLMIAISPNPEMKEFTEKYGLGIVAEDYTPQTMATALNKLSEEQILHFKRQSDKAAKELTAENEMAKLENIIKSII